MASKAELLNWTAAIGLSHAVCRMDNGPALSSLRSTTSKIIMQAASKAQSLSYNGASIMIFEEFSAAVVKKRQDFYSVKQLFKEKGIVFA